MDIKDWNKELKYLRSMILKSEYLLESKMLCMKLHSMVHSSEVSETNEKTFEDDLWEGLDEQTFKEVVNSKRRTIAYGLWHCTRIEDITMNALVANEPQVFFQDKWKEGINTKIIDTGNSMSEKDILVFSQEIDMMELKNYRLAVGRRTRDIIHNLNNLDMKRKFTRETLNQIIKQGCVLDVKESNWLIDFWGRKNVAGILLMPATRHNLVHINESLEAKRKAKRLKKREEG